MRVTPNNKLFFLAEDRIILCKSSGTHLGSRRSSVGRAEDS